jgi:hypothetical protein
MLKETLKSREKFEEKRKRRKMGEKSPPPEETRPGLR